MNNDQAFNQSLALIAVAAQIFRDDWFLIGSVAAKLANANVGEINDIDLLLSEGDIHNFKQHWRGRPILPATPSDQFRSGLFYRFEAPLPIEAMAAFELRTPQGDWKLIEPKTRVQYADMFAPDIDEQISILKLMNRTKDAPRVAALERVQSN